LKTKAKEKIMARNAKQFSPFEFRAVWLYAAAGVLALAATPSRLSAQEAPSQQAAPPEKAAVAQAGPQKKFSSAQEAATALYEAARNHDDKALILILGPASRDVVMWSQSADDRGEEDDNFAKKYEEMHRLVAEPDDETTLYVGAENWPLPFPLVHRGGSWYFDAGLGKQEVVFRRIGQNEMDAMDVLRGMVDAEHQYFADSAGADGAHVYAEHLQCSPGKHDGLDAKLTDASDEEAPIGPLAAQAGFEHSGHIPLHGYYLRILTAQGPHAHGGARDYIVAGKMTGGFAIIAFPAEYRSSGVKTFVISQHGAIYEKDLGPRTTQLASSIKAYDPDSTWTRVMPDQMMSPTPSSVAPK
jgi:hypothetical protein